MNDEIDYEEVNVSDESSAPNTDIEDMINSINQKNYTDAEAKFNELIGDKLQDTLDQAKARIAGQIYNAEVEEEPEEESEVED